MQGTQLVVFDLDGTLVDGDSFWFRLNLAMGVTPEEDKYFYNLYHAGSITFNEWIFTLGEILKERGLANRTAICDVLRAYALAPGAREIVEFLQKQGYHVAIISGAMDLAVEMVASDLGVSLVGYNSTFQFDVAERLQGIHTLGGDDSVKLDQLNGFCQSLGLTLQDCVCVGDGPNDRVLFQATGKGITFTYPRCAVLHDCCWKQVNSLLDLKDILWCRV